MCMLIFLCWFLLISFQHDLSKGIYIYLLSYWIDKDIQDLRDKK